MILYKSCIFLKQMCKSLVESNYLAIDVHFSYIDMDWLLSHRKKQTKFEKISKDKSSMSGWIGWIVHAISISEVRSSSPLTIDISNKKLAYNLMSQGSAVAVQDFSKMDGNLVL